MFLILIFFSIIYRDNRHKEWPTQCIAKHEPLHKNGLSQVFESKLTEFFVFGVCKPKLFFLVMQQRPSFLEIKIRHDVCSHIIGENGTFAAQMHAVHGCSVFVDHSKHREFRTATIFATRMPNWNEIVDVLFSRMNQQLDLNWVELICTLDIFISIIRFLFRHSLQLLHRGTR